MSLLAKLKPRGRHHLHRRVMAVALAWLQPVVGWAQVESPAAAPVPAPALSASGPVAPAAPVAPARATKARPAPQPANVTLNFVNAEIEGVARAIGAVLERQIVVDPRVKGLITLYVEQPLTPREAYLNFLAALRGQGFTVVEVSGLLKVVPEAEAKLQTGVVSAGAVERSGDQVITQIFRLQYGNANAMVTVLRPLISPNNTINADAASNSLVITDYAANLQRIAKIITAMDLPTSAELEIIPLKYAVASDIAVLAQKLGDGPGAAGAASGLVTTVLADPRSNSLMVRAPNQARLASMRTLIDKLDQPSAVGLGGSGIYVVYLKNADAVKLAQVLRAAFSTDSRGAGGSSASGTSSAGAAPSAANAAGTAGASAQATAPVQASAAPSTGGFIQADPSTNSLIITAGEPLYRQLRAVIDQLDSRRAQIYVETMIVELSAGKAAEYGFQWQGLIGKEGDRNGVVLGTNYSGGAGTNQVSLLNATKAFAGVSGSADALGNPQGLNVGWLHNFSGTYALGALAQFLETKGGSNILSTPNLIALDNEEAKITIGSNVPFVTGQYSNAGSGGSPNPFTTVERKDVGITLRVKPQIGENGTIRMTIYQENSSVDETKAANNNGPTTTKSSIETTIVVDDGEVVVLGGLLKDRFSGGKRQVPLLGDLPLIGHLFRSEDRSSSKSNLMVFLRPVILRTQEASSTLALDRYEFIRGQQLNITPTKNFLLSPIENPILPELPPRGAPKKSSLKWIPEPDAALPRTKNAAPVVVPAPRPVEPEPEPELQLPSLKFSPQTSAAPRPAAPAPALSLSRELQAALLEPEQPLLGSAGSPRSGDLAAELDPPHSSSD